MATLLDTVIELKKTEFDVLRSLFPPIEGTSVYLLQEDGNLKPYKQTDNRAAITTGWNVVTDMYQQTRKLQIATAEVNFWKVLLKSSHAAIGEHVFEIDRASAMPPSMRYPHYTVSISSIRDTYTP